MMDLFGVYLSRLLKIDEFEFLMNCVSEQKRAKINKFVYPADANRGLIGEVLIRAIIRSKFHLKNDDITFYTEQFGKPYVKGMPLFHFNISHSGRWIVCAVDCDPVGIDVEEIKPIELEVAKRYFTLGEYQYLMEQPVSIRLSCFYELWTMKESFVKLVGKGLALSPDSFSILPPTTNHHCVRLENSYLSCYFSRFNLDPQYKMTICSTTGDFPAQIIVKSYDEIIIELE